MPKISVILPIYNVVNYIGDCIRSLLNQTFRDFELVVVDDRGSDNSVAIAHELLDNYVEIPIKWFTHDKNRGVSAARNTGFENSSGDYIFFMDNDDFVSPECLEHLYNKAKQSNPDVVVGDFDVEGNGHYIPRLGVMPEYLENDEILEAYLQSKIYMMPWNKLIKQSFLVDNNITFKEGVIHEDELWSFEVACAANKIAFLHEKIYTYRVHPNSIQTDKVFKKHFDAYLNVFPHIYNVAKKYKIECNTQFLSWYERRLAVMFNQTKSLGTKKQLQVLYSVIRTTVPAYKFDKSHIHSYMPCTLGFIFYNRFFKHLLV